MLAWGKKVSEEFCQRIREIAESLGTDPNYLMACMAFESGLNPEAQNKNTHATGLIQFMPQTARDLGTTIEELVDMTAEEQLDYVEEYFKPNKGKLKSLDDVYMAILWPAAVGKPSDYVLFRKDDPKYPQRYEYNKGLDLNKDGIVTKAEAADLVRKKLEEGLTSQYALP